MSIDERLARGLAQNADVAPPPVEHHLERVRTRRRWRLSIRVVATAAAACAVVVGAGSWFGLLPSADVEPAGPSGLAGSYEVTVERGPGSAGLAGTWDVRVDDAGSISVTPAAEVTGTATRTGGYELRGRQLTTDLFVTEPGCQAGGPAVGTYRVVTTSPSARFAEVADGCPARLALFGGTWRRTR